MIISSLVIGTLLLLSCRHTKTPEVPAPTFSGDTIDSIPAQPVFIPFDRLDIRRRMAKKKREGEALVVHVFLPLCDNENQGIVPVSKSLGDGMNPHTNLYWGARYGLRSHFDKLADWERLETIQEPHAHVLERVVFRKNYPSHGPVVLIADAYRGDRMKACLLDYFNALAGNTSDAVYLKFGAPDLFAFNGHNGLMDCDIDVVFDRDSIRKDAVVIACISHSYFRDYLNAAGGYPLVATTHLLAPEAYVLEGVIDSWVRDKREGEILDAAGAAYHQYQQCGERGARQLFTGGW